MMNAEQFLGLTKRQSYELAERLGLMPHLVRIDDRNLFGYPDDQREDRICLELDSRRVTKATIQ